MIDRRLIVLSTFASTGTVTAAAEVLGYSPSAVSTQLRELQHELGVPLLEREGRGMRLTPAGEHLVSRTGDLLALWDAIRSEVDADGPVGTTTLRLGGFSSAATAILTPVAARLERETPGLVVSLVEADPQRCVDLLIAGRLDAAVIVAMQGGPAHDDPRFEQVPLRDDRLDVIVPVDHPLAGRRSVELSDLTGERWITDRRGTPYRALFEAAFTAAGVTPRVAHEVVEWDTAAALVEAGLGVGLIPRLARAASAYDVVRIPVADHAGPRRRIVGVVRRGALGTPLVGRAVAAMRELA